MIKLLLICLLVAGTGYMVINNVPSIRERVVEAINPAYKERRLLGELKMNLTSMEDTLNQASTKKNIAEIQSLVSKSKDTVAQSTQVLNNISDLNDASSGIFSQIVTKVSSTILGNPTPSPTPCTQ